MPKIKFTPLEIPKLKQDKARFLTGFTKMVASGNDFIVVGPLARHRRMAGCRQRRHLPATAEWRGAARGGIGPLGNLAHQLCNRKYGIGADGLLLLEKSKIADVGIRIFNPDGSEAQMCGNGARCVALYSAREQRTENRKQRKMEPTRAKGHGSYGRNTQAIRLTQGLSISIETKAGIIESRVDSNNIKIKLTDPEDIKLDIPVKVNKRNFKVNFIDIGVPHAVIFVEGIDEIHVNEIGRAIRNHKEFSPRGTNVDFVEVLGKDLIGIRTYERGVEDETLACGTGSAASALIFAMKSDTGNKINVRTKSQETLKVYFDRIDNKFKDVWLEGKAKIVYKGEYYV